MRAAPGLATAIAIAIALAIGFGSVMLGAYGSMSAPVSTAPGAASPVLTIVIPMTTTTPTGASFKVVDPSVSG